MGEKKLNLNAPLLSVRRFASPSSSSTRRVNNNEITKSPPKRQTLPLYKSDSDLGEVTKPAAVPFLWEQIPGKPKGERAFDVKKRLSDEDSENAYSDALDTLSQNEPLSASCLSDNDGPDLEPSRAFSVDQQARDFMMRRFLPAAKAMALERPEYVPKKQPVVEESPKPEAKAMALERPEYVPKKQPVVEESPKPEAKAMALEKPEYVPKKQPVVEESRKPFQKVAGVIGDRWALFDQNLGFTNDESSEDEDEKCDEFAQKSGRSFRFFPRICVKNSLCLLNPVPGMKPRIRPERPSKPATPSVPVIKRVAKSAYSGPLDKSVCDYKKKINSGFLSGELYASKHSSFPRDLQRPDALSPYRSFRSSAVSPYRKESPRSPFPAKKQQMSGSVDPTAEKFLYVDSLNSSKRHPNLDRKSEAKMVDPSNIGPPLPKSPSEPWLWRNLQSISSVSKRHSEKNVAKDSKWETIVKTSR